VYSRVKLILGMKSFAISIACAISAIGFTSPAISGDLGRADIAVRNDLPVEYSYSANCFGSLDKERGPECSVDFVDGKLTVDGSAGIFPHQVTSVTEKYYNGAYHVNLQYQTSVGNASIAQFSFFNKTTAKQFVNTVVLFMGDALQSQEPIVDSSEPIVEDTMIETPAPTLNSSECEGPSILCF
tara:strand:+ start:1283 stop:1834 length:552 start_codon:yes stop_codon:yes gene_type:complete